MELVCDSFDRKVYEDDDKEYIVMDNGSTIGRAYREWYEEVPEVWMLMKYNDKTNNIHIDAKINEQGEYDSFDIRSNGNYSHECYIRTIKLYRGCVYSDCVAKLNYKDSRLNKYYVAIDIDKYRESKTSILDYLSYEQNFKNGNEMISMLKTNKSLIDFIQNKDILYELSNESKTL